MFSEGYIGITTKTPRERFLCHKSDAKLGKTTILSNAIRKYGKGIIVTAILEGNTEYCLDVESKLRNQERIGWNIVKGGGIPPVHKNHTEESKRKIGEGARRTAGSPGRVTYAESRRGVLREDSVKAKMKLAAQGRLSWETSRANKDVWLQAVNIFEHHNLTGYGSINLEKFLGYSKGTLTAMVKKFKKQNWNPNNDPEWMLWVQNYKLNKEYS